MTIDWEELRSQKWARMVEKACGQAVANVWQCVPAPSIADVFVGNVVAVNRDDGTVEVQLAMPALPTHTIELTVEVAEALPQPSTPLVGKVVPVWRKGERQLVRLDEHDYIRRSWRARVVDEHGVLGCVVTVDEYEVRGVLPDMPTREAPYRPPARKRYGVGQ